jgi:hypothetical protein
MVSAFRADRLMLSDWPGTVKRVNKNIAAKVADAVQISGTSVSLSMMHEVFSRATFYIFCQHRGP